MICFWVACFCALLLVCGVSMFNNTGLRVAGVVWGALCGVLGWMLVVLLVVLILIRVGLWFLVFAGVLDGLLVCLLRVAGLKICLMLFCLAVVGCGGLDAFVGPILLLFLVH